MATVRNRSFIDDRMCLRFLFTQILMTFIPFSGAMRRRAIAGVAKATFAGSGGRLPWTRTGVEPEGVFKRFEGLRLWAIKALGPASLGLVALRHDSLSDSRKHPTVNRQCHARHKTRLFRS